VLPEIIDLCKRGCLCPVWRIVYQFKASDIVAPIGELWSPQHDTSGEQLSGCNTRDIERHQSLWLLWRVIGKSEGSSHDVCTGEDVPFSHQKACADHLAIRRVDTYE